MRRCISPRKKDETVFSSVDHCVVEQPGIQMTMKFCLITDDSPIVRKVARRMLQSLEFEVDEAENGQIALDKCASRMPDTILLDWNMPTMNGIEFLRSLRRMEG